jgi:hypothetical protein
VVPEKVSRSRKHSKYTGANFKTGCIVRDFCDFIFTINICIKFGHKVSVHGVYTFKTVEHTLTVILSGEFVAE